MPASRHVPLVSILVLALAAQQEMTTAQLAERLPDVAHATLYRHVAVLAEGGGLEVVDERRVRGGCRARAAVTHP